MNITGLDPDVFNIAGWLHDIYKINDDANHHRRGLKQLYIFLFKYPEFKSMKDAIADCIFNHRYFGNPTTEYGKIMKDADKKALEHDDWKAFR
ncbi:MAG: HD domain-containing protein [Candidatus Aenigmatarchaeota archaeon]